MNQLPLYEGVVSMKTPAHAEKRTSTMKVMPATGNPAHPL
jgi:hypothetical protein